MNRIDGGLQVPVKRLDDLVAGAEPIALLKVDVEGYEKQVFEGAPAVLKRTRCVHLEVSTLHFPRFGYTTRDLLKLVRDAGFALFRLAPRQFMPITVDFETAPFENLVAVPDADEFARRTGWSQVPRCA